jgi:flagellar basal-body rod protein FlgC
MVLPDRLRMNHILKLFVVFTCALLFVARAHCDDPLLQALKVAQSGASLQAARMKVVSENIANAESVSTKKQPAYCRRIVLVKNGERRNKIVKYRVRKSFVKPFVKKYDPTHPYADKNGYIRMSNVNKDIERADAAEAQVSYEANLKMIKALGNMTNTTIELLK